MAVLMLAERGDLSLDESPGVYLEGLPEWSEQLTLNDLMHHTSGISDVVSLPASVFGPAPLTNADALEFVRTSPLCPVRHSGRVHTTRTRTMRCLPDIVVEVTGTEFSVWMEANVFAPLDLEARIGPPVPSDPMGYEGDVNAEFSAVEALPWVLSGAGFVTMTPSDLVRWGDQLRQPSLVSAETLADALRNAAPSVVDLPTGRVCSFPRWRSRTSRREERVSIPRSGPARTGIPRAPCRAIRTGSIWTVWATTSSKYGSTSDRSNEPSRTHCRLRSVEGEDDLSCRDRGGESRPLSASFTGRPKAGPSTHAGIDRPLHDKTPALACAAGESRCCGFRCRSLALHMF